MHWSRMKSIPCRPLILKRWKRPLPQGDSSCILGTDEPNDDSTKRKQARTNRDDTKRQPEIPEILPGIKITDDSTMPNAQVVTFPLNAGIQNTVEALTPKGKQSSSNEPDKFILFSGDASSPTMEKRAFKTENRSLDEQYAANNGARREEKYIGQHSETTKVSTFCTSESLPVGEQKLEENGSGETTSSGLDNSLTNIQWLGKMSSSGLNPCNVKKETEKENQTPKQKVVKVEEESAAPSTSSSWQESFRERPPYSYMAMIQFAINSTETKSMMLKDIYAWIEDHFPYFKHVAKPGWKNSIRHNLSLHDMFVRETSANGKISFWTIHPDAKRCLTLDQVFKQQKRHTMDLQKNMGGSSGSKSEPPIAGRKMKPLLPRVSSYLVPVQFPASPSLILQPSPKVSLPTPQGASEKKSSKQVRIAPKVFPSLPPPTQSKSRRKQHLVLSCSEEPVLVLPCSGSSDPSTLEHGLPFGQGTPPLGNMAQCSSGEGGPPKTPIQEMFCKPPDYATPGKTPASTLSFLPLTDTWKPASSVKETTSDLDFSPARTPPVPLLSLEENTEPLGFRSTPPRHSPCDSPHLPFLDAGAHAMVSGPLTSSPAPSKHSSPELQDLTLPESPSRLEGLVLDNMNDSLSKILLDVSFSGLDEDNLGADFSWSQLIPELK